jgi:putative aldouronate transport system permease protein
MARLESGGERAFKSLAFVVLLMLTICALLPFVLIIVSSLTDESSLVSHGYSFWPAKWSTVSYEYIIQQAAIIFRSYGISILVTSVGTAISLIITTMLAYPMARPDFRYRNVFAFLVFFTMLFSGGIVPSYMMWTRVFHITNTIWALIVPNYLMTAINVLLVRNYFKNNVPLALIESAQIDGASEIKILFRIMLPLAVPVCVTISLFTGLAYWNDWINALYYINKPSLYGIQNFLMRMMDNIQFLSSSQGSQLTAGHVIALPSVGIRMALAVIGIIPILVTFPLLQRYLIKGVVVGAIKG